MNDARLDLRLPAELLERVKAAAGDRPVNAFVRDALEEAIGPAPKTINQAMKAGLQDAKDSGALDAPTNADLGARMELVRLAPVVKQRARPDRPSVAPDDYEIPLPKIAPRRWGK